MTENHSVTIVFRDRERSHSVHKGDREPEEGNYFHDSCLPHNVCTALINTGRVHVKESPYTPRLVSSKPILRHCFYNLHKSELRQ